MKVLVACEESQRVCTAFRERGHEAYSCDILECSGGHPEWHIRDDVLKHLDGWDLIIAHPPCTFLTVTANSWYDIGKYGEIAKQRYKDRYQAIVFFMQLALANCERVAVENPIGIMSTAFRKPDQIIQPWMFGHPTRKSTCLWLKGLPKLEPTEIVDPIIIRHKSGKTDDIWHFETMRLPKAERSRLRSQTFPGIAKAMAEQWG